VAKAQGRSGARTWQIALVAEPIAAALPDPPEPEEPEQLEDREPQDADDA
jgi:hypothetical protein